MFNQKDTDANQTICARRHHTIVIKDVRHPMIIYSWQRGRDSDAVGEMRGFCEILLCHTVYSLTAMIIVLYSLRSRDMRTDEFHDLRHGRPCPKNATHTRLLKDRNVVVSENPAYYYHYIFFADFLQLLYSLRA